MLLVLDLMMLTVYRHCEGATRGKIVVLDGISHNENRPMTRTVDKNNNFFIVENLVER